MRILSSEMRRAVSEQQHRCALCAILRLADSDKLAASRPLRARQAISPPLPPSSPLSLSASSEASAAAAMQARGRQAGSQGKASKETSKQGGGYR